MRTPSDFDSTDRELWDSFVDASVSPDDWNHEAHVRIAYLHLRQFSFEEALELVRTRIQRLNESHGTPESLERGYHETITQAFMRLIASAIIDAEPCNSREFCEQHPRLLQKRVLLDYYSRERIVSFKAKHTFVSPDLKQFP